MPSVIEATAAHTATLAMLHQAHFKRGWSEAEFSSFFTRDGVISYLLQDNSGLPAGFIFCWAVAGECELLCLAVSEHLRGQGHARHLCERAMADAKTHHAACMHLEVALSNHTAQGLYKSLGFEVVRRRKDYYHYPDHSREDALTMRADL